MKVHEDEFSRRRETLDGDRIDGLNKETITRRDNVLIIDDDLRRIAVVGIVHHDVDVSRCVSRIATKKSVRDDVILFKDGGKEGEALVDLDRFILCIGRDDRDKSVLLLRIAHRQRRVRRLEIGDRWLDPDLKNVRVSESSLTKLAVDDSSTSRSELNVTSLADLLVSHAVLVSESAADDVGEDLIV